MKKTAVIFDMDGLMFDTQCIYNKSYDEIAMSLYGFKVPPDMYLALMGSSGEDIVRAAARFMPEGVDARKFIRQSFDRVAELVKTKLPARPGLDVILPYLKEKGYRLGIASGSERRVVDNNLQSSGLGHYFAASLCGDEVVHSKPDPESYLRVAEMIGKKPEECFVLVLTVLQNPLPLCSFPSRNRSQRRAAHCSRIRRTAPEDPPRTWLP